MFEIRPSSQKFAELIGDSQETIENIQDLVIGLDSFDEWKSQKEYITPLKAPLRKDRQFTNSHSHIALLKDFGQKRNTVILIDFNGLKLVAKRFARPRFPSGIIKRFTGTKAEKGYLNALLLKEKGFKTAAPIVWWERREKGIITDSWLVTEYLDHHLISEFRDIYHNPEQKKVLMQALSQFMTRLHNAGFLPLDFNIGNIFYSASKRYHAGNEALDIKDIYDFYLIDINRMNYGKIPSFNEAMKSFDQLGILPDEYEYLLYPYADAKGWNRKMCIDKILKIRYKNYCRKKIIHLFRNCLNLFSAGFEMHF